MPENKICPNCLSKNILYSKKRDLYICEECNNEFKDEKSAPSHLRIFLSYGHDQNEELVQIIKSDLEKRGHDVWFDKSGIKEHGIIPGEDWRRSITDGIVSSNRVVSFLSRYSTRDPGVCLDEISIAIGVKGGNIQTILVESEKEVQAPPSISHIQWLDMHDWKEKKAEGTEIWGKWYNEKFIEILEVIESDESRRFAGEIENLAGYLKPISSDSRISQLLRKGFVGRKWVLDSIEQWRTRSDRSSRLFWILGNPGVGKSAILAHLSHFGKDKVIAAQFCEYDKPDHRNASRVICNLAFQMATHLPDYRKLLLTLPEIDNLETKGESELFDYLFTNPLRMVPEGGRESYLILIDALDEAKEGEQNPLVEMLARHTPRLPEWLGIIVTSRPEKNVTDPLQGLNPFVLDTDSEINREDIRHYLELELKVHLAKRSDAENIINQILMKSEGVFLYAERVCSDIVKGNLSLERTGEFPIGLGGIYFQFFHRQFQDIEIFRKKVRPALRAVLASKEPLPVNLLGKLFRWNREELNDFTRSLGSLFPLLQESGVKVIKNFHKSIVDWITDEYNAGAFFVDIMEGDKLLSDFGWQQYIQGPEKLDAYFIKWLPRHLLKLERWDDLVDLLCDLEYIQTKSASKQVYHLVEDFNIILHHLPDNAENIKNEKIRQAMMEKYAKDLIALARGEISILDVPESIIPWTQKKIDAEINRMKANPARLDRLNDFLKFLGRESGNLQKYAAKFSHFTTQQAWNYADIGPVGKSAEKGISEINYKLFLRSRNSRPSWNPLPQILQILKGHTEYVCSVAITNNGKRAVSGSWDKTCIHWDLATGESLLTLSGHKEYINAVTITPEGKWAISGSSDRTCILWDLRDGKALRILNGHSDTVNSVAITPDGKLAVSGSSDKTCILWDLTTGENIRTFAGHSDKVLATAITPDGKQIISGSSDKTCILWDSHTGKILQILKGHHTGRVLAVAITPDGKWAISGSSDKTCIMWNLSSGKTTQTLKGHKSWVNAVAITPDGRRAFSGSSDTTCVFWELKTGEVLQILKGHKDWIKAVSITPDGKLAISASWDQTCILWDLGTRETQELLKRHKKKVNAIATTSDGKKAVSSSSDNPCVLWDIETGKMFNLLNNPKIQSNAVAITPDGKRIIAGSSDYNCIIWDLSNGEVIHNLIGHTNFIRTIAITPDGKKAISGSSDNTCIIWNLLTGQAIQILKGHKDWVNAVAITPDGKMVISGSKDNSCILWNLETGKVLRIIAEYADWVKSVAIASNGMRFLSGLSSKNCVLSDLRTGRMLQTLTGHADWVNAVAITPDGRMAISASDDHCCILWDLETGEAVQCFISDYAINTFSFSPTGILLGCDSGEVISLTVDNHMLVKDAANTTIRRIWDFESRHYQKPSTDCPLCGHRFIPPASVLKAIDNIINKAGLRPEQSPCLDLPKEAWDEPVLMSNCPKCGRELRFNPFVAGNEN